MEIQVSIHLFKMLHCGAMPYHALVIGSVHTNKLSWLLVLYQKWLHIDLIMHYTHELVRQISWQPWLQHKHLFLSFVFRLGLSQLICSSVVNSNSVELTMRESLLMQSTVSIYSDIRGWYSITLTSLNNFRKKGSLVHCVYKPCPTTQYGAVKLTITLQYLVT